LRPCLVVTNVCTCRGYLVLCPDESLEARFPSAAESPWQDVPLDGVVVLVHVVREVQRGEEVVPKEDDLKWEWIGALN